MKYYKLDKDVKQYLKRMNADGIKTPADIYSVNDFIVGLKDLNLQDFVEVYFYGNVQNSESGNKIYAFKNPLYDGTISGLHNRRVDGVELKGGETSKIDTNFPMPFSPCSNIFVYRSNAVVNVFVGDIFFTAGVNFNGNQIVIANHSLPDSRVYVSAKGNNWDTTISTTDGPGGKKDGKFHMIMASMPTTKGPLRTAFDTTFVTGSAYGGAGGYDSVQGFYRVKQYTANNSLAIVNFAIFYNRVLSDTEYTNIYNLVKSTIGRRLLWG